MEVRFENTNLADSRKRKGKYGTVCKQIERRIIQFESTASLARFEEEFPGSRCHEYVGDKKGTFAVDISGNYRLRFRPTTEPARKQDGSVDKNSVISITIIKVLAPH